MQHEIVCFLTKHILKYSEMGLNKSKAQAEMLALFSCPQEMNTVPYLSKDQIATAREMDLLTYLRRFDPE